MTGHKKAKNNGNKETKNTHWLRKGTRSKERTRRKVRKKEDCDL
jgi:hypothetical protein